MSNNPFLLSLNNPPEFFEKNEPKSCSEFLLKRSPNKLFLTGFRAFPLFDLSRLNFWKISTLKSDALFVLSFSLLIGIFFVSGIFSLFSFSIFSEASFFSFF